MYAETQANQGGSVLVHGYRTVPPRLYRGYSDGYSRYNGRYRRLLLHGANRGNRG
jgi:hypothetical protein